MRSPEIHSRNLRKLAPEPSFLFQHFANKVGFVLAHSWPSTQTGDSWDSEVLQQAFVAGLKKEFASNADDSCLQEYRRNNPWLDLCFREDHLYSFVSLQVIPYEVHSRQSNSLTLTPLEEVFDGLSPLPGLHWCFLIQYPLTSIPALNIPKQSLRRGTNRRICLDAMHDLKIYRERQEWARLSIWFEDRGEILPEFVFDSLPPGRYEVNIIGLRPTYGPGHWCGTMWMEMRAQLRNIRIDGEGTLEELEALMVEYKRRYDGEYQQILLRTSEGLPVSFTPNEWWMSCIWTKMMESGLAKIPYFQIVQKLAEMPDFTTRRHYLDSIWSHHWNAIGSVTKCPETLSNFLYGQVFCFHPFRDAAIPLEGESFTDDLQDL